MPYNAMSPSSTASVAICNWVLALLMQGDQGKLRLDYKCRENVALAYTWVLLVVFVPLSLVLFVCF